MTESFTYEALAGGKRISLKITGVIGGSLFSDNGVTADSVIAAVETAPNADDIDVFIDSKGGDFFEGVRMYQALNNHPAKVHVTLGSVAASAATVVMMAGDDIVADETTSILIHNARGPQFGTAVEMRKKADALETLSEAMVNAYVTRTGMAPEKVRALMDDDRFMSLKEALELGFITEVHKGKRTVRALNETEYRAEFEDMRTRVQSSVSALQIAAMAPPEPTIEPPAPCAPVDTKDESSMAQLVIVLAALGLTESNTDAEVMASISKLKSDSEASARLVASIGAKTLDEAIGTVAALQANRENTDADGYGRVMAALGAKSPDEALGMVAAYQSAKDRLVVVESKLNEQIQAQEINERNEIIAKLETEGKCTPAQKDTLFPGMSLASLKSFAVTAVPVLRGDGRKQPGNKSISNKAWAEMSAEEQRELYNTDRPAFEAAYESYNSSASRA